MPATADELVDVSRDLCVVASVLFAAGLPERADLLVEQAADLLLHRARLYARRPRRESRNTPRDGSEELLADWRVMPWMN